MYVYCVYPAMSKSSNTCENVTDKAETCIVLIVFNGIAYHVIAKADAICNSSLNTKQVSEKLY